MSDELQNLQRDLDAAKLRRHQALQRFGAGSSQFASALDEIAKIEQRIAEVHGK